MISLSLNPRGPRFRHVGLQWEGVGRVVQDGLSGSPSTDSAQTLEWADVFYGAYGLDGQDDDNGESPTPRQAQLQTIDSGDQVVSWVSVERAESVALYHDVKNEIPVDFRVGWADNYFPDGTPRFTLRRRVGEPCYRIKKEDGEVEQDWTGCVI